MFPASMITRSKIDLLWDVGGKVRVGGKSIDKYQKLLCRKLVPIYIPISTTEYYTMKYFIILIDKNIYFACTLPQRNHLMPLKLCYIHIL